MAAPTSAVDICNLALDHLKQAPITDIASPITEVEALMARHYDQARRACLRKHPWNFAIKRAQLAANATVPLFGWAYAYDLPNDFLRLLTIGDDYVGDIRRKYQVEGKQLLYASDAATDALDVRYVYDFTNVAQMDPLFVDILSLELALRVARKFTGNEDVVINLREDLKRVAPEGYAIDGQERPPQRIQTSRWATMRRNGRTFRGNAAGPHTIFES